MRAQVLHPCRGTYFCLPQNAQRAYGAQQVSYLMGAMFFADVNRPRREVDHSPPPNVKVKNEWSYTSAPPICLNYVDRDNFTVTLLYVYIYITKSCVQSTENLPARETTHTHNRLGYAAITLTTFISTVQAQWNNVCNFSQALTLAPWWWFLREPKHVGAAFVFLMCL